MISSQSNPSSTLIWQVAMFYGWIFLSILAMVGFLVAVSLRLRATPSMPLTVRLSIKKLMLYPLVWMMCWIPNIICTFFQNFVPNNDNVALVETFGTVPLSVQPFFMTVIFFTQNRFVRNKWISMIKSKICPTLCNWMCGDTCGIFDMETSALMESNSHHVAAADEWDYMDDTAMERDTVLGKVSFSNVIKSSFSFHGHWRSSQVDQSQLQSVGCQRQFRESELGGHITWKDHTIGENTLDFGLAARSCEVGNNFGDGLVRTMQQQHQQQQTAAAAATAK